jgi:FixJ family two-component response regulator
LRREWPAVKIVAMSGAPHAGSLDVAHHALALGADRFLEKPFESTMLVTVIAGLLAQRDGGTKG